MSDQFCNPHPEFRIRMPFLMFMLAALIVLLAGTILLMAQAILRPPRMTDGKAIYLLHRIGPDDLGIAYERMTFAVRDEASGGTLNLAGWWMPHPTGGDRAVVLIHGYADAKVGAIAWAPTWRALGYHILAIDLRAHGESDGKFMTAGVREREDLDQVLNQLRASKPAQTSHLVLFGISLGGVTALATAAKREDIAATVLESPVIDFRSGLQAHGELVGLPLPMLLPVVLRVAGWISHADFDSVRPLELIRECRGPVMLIHGDADPFLLPGDSASLKTVLDARQDGSVVWQVPGAAHLMALQQVPDEYRDRIGAFLDKRSE